MKSLLQLLVSVLATISVIIFAILTFLNSLKDSKVFPKGDEYLLLSYLTLLLLGITIYVFVLTDIIVLTYFTFTLCMMIFLLCFLHLIPISLMIISYNTKDYIHQVRDSILSDLFPSIILRRVIRRDEIEKKIGEIKRFCLISLDTHNQIALESGINDFKTIAERLIENKQIEDIHSNIIVKDIIRCWHEIGIRCLELHKYELSIIIVKNIGESIFKGVQKERDFQYHDMINYLVDLALEAIKLDSKQIIRRILVLLWRIGQESKGKELRYLRVESIIDGLQKIGNECKKRGMKDMDGMATNLIKDLK